MREAATNDPSKTDDRNTWNRDVRPIVAAQSAYPGGEGGSVLLTIDGWSFERFERCGEMAFIPYLRATRNGYSVEAPLSQWPWVQFAESVE
jgi:hypothetical protein